MFDSSVSVVIPAYNSQAYIGAALDSVLAQTDPVNEIIVVDDGSTDSTQNIVEAYPQVKWIARSHQGPSAARNQGIRRAQNAWVAFLDSDDLWDSEKIKRQISVLASFPSAVFSFCTLKGFMMREEIAIEIGAYVPNALRDWLADKHGDNGAVYGDVYKLLLETNFINTSSVIARRDALIEAGMFDETRSHGEDHDLWLRLSRRWPAVFIIDPVARNRIHSTSISGEVINRKALFYRSTIEVLTKHRREFPSLAAAKALAKVYNDFAAYHLKNRDCNEARKLALKGLGVYPTPSGLRYCLEAVFPRAYSQAAGILRGGRVL